MQRQILITLLLAVFIALLGIGIIVPVMPFYAERLGAKGITLGLIIAAFSISRGLLQPLVGGISDRLGRKGFLLAGLLVYTLVGLALPYATSVSHLILIRAVHGVGSAMIVPVAMACMGDLAPAGKEGRYMGLLNSALFAGIGGGPMLGGFFSDSWGMAAAFHAMAALSALSLALVLAYLPEPRAERKEYGSQPLHAVFRRMLGSTRTVGILLARMSTMIIMVPTMAFLPILMSRTLASSGLEIGMVVASRTLVSASLQHVFGRLADRYEKTRLLVLGCIVITAAMLAVPLAAGQGQLIALFVLLGSGEAMVWPALTALATEEGRIYGQGAMMGVFNLAMSVGIFLGSLGAGFIMDRLGLAAAFVIIAVTVLAGTLGAVRLIHTEDELC